MKQISRWFFIILVITVLQLASCAKPASTPQKTSPSRLEPINGTDTKRVILTEKAAKRLDIQTVMVTNGQVNRKQIVGGEVVVSPLLPLTNQSETPVINPDEAWVQISLNSSDLMKIDRAKPALILPKIADVQVTGLTANEFEIPDPNLMAAEERTRDLFYIIKGKEANLAPGQRVGVELAMLGNGTKRIVIPYSAVIYDQKGGTWVYTNPEPLVFVRRSIVVDYIEGDLAFLTVGPPSGIKIVTVGAAELLGAETGVSK
jgi:hypothetical protein